jgi:hypothetical protein
MKTTSFLAGGILLLSAVGVVSAKSWDIALDTEGKAGNVMLPAGEYHVKIDSNDAIFTAVDSGKAYNVPAKLATEPRKYDQTALEFKSQGNTEIIEAIDLGGTTTKLEFGD